MRSELSFFWFFCTQSFGEELGWGWEGRGANRSFSCFLRMG